MIDCFGASWNGRTGPSAGEGRPDVPLEDDRANRVPDPVTTMTVAIDAGGGAFRFRDGRTGVSILMTMAMMKMVVKMAVD